MVATWGELARPRPYLDHVAGPRPAGALGQRGARTRDPRRRCRSADRPAHGRTGAEPTAQHDGPAPEGATSRATRHAGARRPRGNARERGRATARGRETAGG